VPVGYSGWIIILAAPFVLIESREFLQGFWALPALMSLCLILLGADAVFVLPAAFLVQITYHQRIASGAVLYPEYAYANWLVCGLCGSIAVLVPDCLVATFALVLLLVKAVAALGAVLIRLKRELLGRYVSSMISPDDRMSVILVSSLLLSYLIFFIPALLISCFFDSILNFIPQLQLEDLLKLALNLFGAALILWFNRRLFLDLFRSKNNLTYCLSGVVLAVLLSLII